MTTIGRSKRKCTALIIKINSNSERNCPASETTTCNLQNLEEPKVERTTNSIKIYQSNQKHHRIQSCLNIQSTFQIFFLETRARLLFVRTHQTQATHFFHTFQTFYN